jgi:hypothetical protein
VSSHGEPTVLSFYSGACSGCGSAAAASGTWVGRVGALHFQLRHLKIFESENFVNVLRTSISSETPNFVHHSVDSLRCYRLAAQWLRR